MSGSGSSSTQYTSFCANGRWAGSSLAAAGVAGAVVQGSATGGQHRARLLWHWTCGEGAQLSGSLGGGRGFCIATPFLSGVAVDPVDKALKATQTWGHSQLCPKQL